MRWTSWSIAVQVILLASADHHTPVTSEQAHPVNTTYTNHALHPMFRYIPRQEWPRDPSDGWNFSSTVGRASSYTPPERRLAYPLTSFPDAEVSDNFWGNGVTLSGWAASGTAIMLGINDGQARRIVFASETEGELGSVRVAENGWRTFKLTLVQGSVQLTNVTYHQTLDLAYPSQEQAPERTIKAVNDDGTTINPFFDLEGEMRAQDGDIVGEGPVVAMSPEARISFRTWPNATMVRLLGQVGRQGGIVAFGLVPEPVGASIVTADVLRSHDYYMDVGYFLIDPKARFTVNVKNYHASSKIYFRGVNFLLASDDGLNWDPTTDTLWGPSNSSSNGTSRKGGGQGDSSDERSGAEQESIKRTNVGAIVGGVIGGLVGAALLGLLLIWCIFPACLQRLFPNRAIPPPQAGEFTVDENVLDVTETAADPVVTPLPAPALAPASSSGYKSSQYGFLPSKEETQQGLSADRDGGSNAENAEEHPAVEDDAGPVPFRTARADTLPPTYNPAWADTGFNASEIGPLDTSSSSPMHEEYKALASSDPGSGTSQGGVGLRSEAPPLPPTTKF